MCYENLLNAQEARALVSSLSERLFGQNMEKVFSTIYKSAEKGWSSVEITCENFPYIDFFRTGTLLTDLDFKAKWATRLAFRVNGSVLKFESKEYLLVSW